MKKVYLLLALTLGSGMVARGGVETQRLAQDVEEVHCTSLTHIDFADTMDAPTQITEASAEPASDQSPAYCRVRGYVAPAVGFVLVLPAKNWNGKFLEQGCGGFCGGDLPERIASIWGKPVLLDSLRRGYAFLIFDGGHVHGVLDALWAYNNPQAQFDFGIRAPHVAALAGKAITERYYNATPAKSYFTGCSSGGQQALSEAQRFPWDFDGIIAGAPSPTFSGPMMNYLWAGRALAGTINEADLRLIHETAVARCDMDDGVKDGIISDPQHCRFDPEELLCKADRKEGNCLTAAQVAAVKKVYAGPMTSKGEKLYTGGPLPGSELNWISESDAPSAAYVNHSGMPEPWAKEYFAYIGFIPAPGSSWRPDEFDFDRDYKRLRMAESLFGSADNPDLRKFKAAGGKLILYQGLQDQSDIPSDSIDYYETTERTLGDHSATQAFFRLFLIPGMNHCTGGAGAFAIDYLSYLEAWVEKRQAPEKMIGAHVVSNDYSDWVKFPLAPSMLSFTRPIYPYPIRAKYWKGDPNSAASFGPTAQER
jgi:hypothetical protein